MDNFKNIEDMVDPVKVAALINYAKDFKDIDPNYPTTDELDRMKRFFSHFIGFIDFVGRGLDISDTIALYAVYVDARRD